MSLVLSIILFTSILGITTQAAAPGLWGSNIQEIYVGDTIDGPWLNVPMNTVYNPHSATVPASYTYVRVIFTKWGEATYQQYRMDGNQTVTSRTLEKYDSDGNICPIGGIIYGEKKELIWRIPDTARTSQVKITLDNNMIPNSYEVITCDIAWEGAGGAAPSTPFILDNDSSSVILNGTDSTMEYKKDSDTVWTYCDFAQVVYVGTEDQIIVRYAATDTTRASESLVLQLTRSAAPLLTYNSSTEVISGLSPDMEMSINGAPYQQVLDTVNGSLKMYKKGEEKMYKSGIRNRCFQTEYC